MRQILFGCLWLAAFAAAGAVAGHRFIPPHFQLPPADIGAIAGFGLALTLAGLGWLPGAKTRRGAALLWGWRQAVWMVVQFFTMQVAGQTLCVALLIGGGLIAARLRHTPPTGLFDGTGLIIATMTGYLAAAGWSVWYISRLGPARVRDGSPLGIGWCHAPREAYLAALAGLAVVGVISFLVQHLLPPSALAEKNDPFQQIFGSHGWKVGVLFVLAAVVAPFTEELVMRGGVFSALAPGCGTFWAAVITAIVFTLAHAQEFWSYLPGMIVIGAVAAVLGWLRIRYQSIRPGILLHILFNGLSVLALAVSH